MNPRWHIDDEVRLTRNVRDDGTFPGAQRGDLLVRRGSVGVIRDIGSFLQEQVIYGVYFYAEKRMVGCREEELMDAADAWTPTRFEFRDKVKSRAALQVKGKILVEAGEWGEITKVACDSPGGTSYHVHFDCLPGRVLLIPETVLEA
jgi:nitrogen fixation protein NifZ